MCDESKGPPRFRDFFSNLRKVVIDTTDEPYTFKDPNRRKLDEELTSHTDPRMSVSGQTTPHYEKVIPVNKALDMTGVPLNDESYEKLMQTSMNESTGDIGPTYAHAQEGAHWATQFISGVSSSLPGQKDSSKKMDTYGLAFMALGMTFAFGGALLSGAQEHSLYKTGRVFSDPRNFRKPPK